MQWLVIWDATAAMWRHCDRLNIHDFSNWIWNTKAMEIYYPCLPCYNSASVSALVFVKSILLSIYVELWKQVNNIRISSMLFIYETFLKTVPHLCAYLYAKFPNKNVACGAEWQLSLDNFRQHVICVSGVNGGQMKYPDSKVHGANMGPTWVLSAPDGPHVGPMNLAIRVCLR